LRPRRTAVRREYHPGVIEAQRSQTADDAIPPCEACGAAALLRFMEMQDHRHRAVPGHFATWRCQACGTIVFWPQPDDATLNAAYVTNYAPFQEKQSLISKIGEPLAQREATRLAHIADPASRLVDVGCGSGIFLARLRRAGWTGELRGVEPNPSVAAATSKRLSIHVDVATAESVELEPNAYGAIVLRHVIEHVREPRVVLRRLLTALAPGGILYLPTPDARALGASIFGGYWPGYDPPRHLYVFSSAGVRAMVAAVGYELVDEHWQFSPQMWTGGMRQVWARGRESRWAPVVGNDLNPIAALPAIAGAVAEVVTHRSTMYAATARRPLEPPTASD
jgi:SAM-dependent methyltransferase